MLMSGLLIDLTGGRIETHFHIFGALAFLSFYRDWRVLVTASAVVAAEMGSTVEKSALAWASDSPGFNRPNTFIIRISRSSM